MGRSRTRSASAHNAVLRGIGLAILSGEFPGGSVLPGKDALMRRFGVSKSWDLRRRRPDEVVLPFAANQLTAAVARPRAEVA